MYFSKLVQHAPYDVEETKKYLLELKCNTIFLIEELGKHGRIHLQGIITHEHTADHIQRRTKGAKLRYKSEKYSPISLVSNYKGENITADGGEIFTRYLCKGYYPEKRSPVKVKLIHPLTYLMDTNILEKQDKYWEINADLKSSQRLYKKIKNITIDENRVIPNLSFRDRQRIFWYMKIVLYYDQEDKLQPSHFQIKKMVETYMFREIPQTEKEEYAFKLASYLLN